jgi:hypothetical protein
MSGIVYAQDDPVVGESSLTQRVRCLTAALWMPIAEAAASNGVITVSPQIRCWVACFVPVGMPAEAVDSVFQLLYSSFKLCPQLS